MVREVFERGELIKRFVNREKMWLEEQIRNAPDAEKWYGKLQAEPISALFADHVTVTAGGVVNANNPLEATVTSSVDITWNEHATAMLRELEELRIPLQKLARTGGLYQRRYANKRIRKWVKGLYQLIHDAPLLWQSADWVNYIRELLVAMLEVYRDKTLENLEVLRIHPELVIGDKEPNTSTGWAEPLDTRGRMAENLPMYVDTIRDICTQYYNDLIDAVRDWPSKDSLIYIGGNYRGITGGARSDVDVTQWIGDHQDHESQTREVGNDPSSAFHNKKLNPPEWQNALWKRFASEYHLLPQDPESYLLAMTTPPATMEGDPEEKVLLSADFGWAQFTARLVNGALQIVNEGISFGADGISLVGIFLRPMAGKKDIAMEKSGTPFTMPHYLIMIGMPLAFWARSLNLTTDDFQIMQVGDDLQILIKRKYLEPLLTAFGHYLRVKGMTVVADGPHIVFILGSYIAWESRDRITVFTMPRGVKSVSSAARIAKGEVPDGVEPHTTYSLDVSAEAKEQSEIFWTQYPKAVLFTGSPAEYLEWGRVHFSEAKAAAAKLGYSEWYLDFAQPSGRSVAREVSDEMQVAIRPLPEQEAAKDVMPIEVPAEQLATQPTQEGTTVGQVDTTVEQAPVDGEAPDTTRNDTQLPRVGPVLVYGFPTTGKTFAAEMLAKVGYRVLDCDECSKQALSELGMENEKPWRDPESEAYARFQEAYTNCVRRGIESGDYDVVFSNSWELFKTLGRKADIAFIRDSAEEVSRLSGGRGDEGGGIPLDVVERWLADVSSIEAAVGPLTHLSAGQYMYDAVRGLLPEVKEGS